MDNIQKDNSCNVIASVVLSSNFLATSPEDTGPILCATTFSEKYLVWNGVHSSS
jgi:hypothetical protein